MEGEDPTARAINMGSPRPAIFAKDLQVYRQSKYSVIY